MVKIGPDQIQKSRIAASDEHCVGGRDLKWHAEGKIAMQPLPAVAWSGLSGCFTAPVLMALFYSRMTRLGCLAGIISGGTTSLLWHHFPPLGFASYELIPAVLVSASSIWWVSRLSRESSHRQEL